MVDEAKPSPDVEPHVESLEGMTVIDEISDESEAILPKKDADIKDEDSVIICLEIVVFNIFNFIHIVVLN